MAKYYLSEIRQQIDVDYALEGAFEDIYIDKLSTPYRADEHSLIFISPERLDKQNMLNATRARVIICDDSLDLSNTKNKCLIKVKNPKYIFAKIGNDFFIEKPAYSIHPTAIIHPDAVIAKNVHIGPNVYIGKCTLKDHVIIHGNCYLYDNVTLHENVVIHAGCIIGASGLGHIRGDENEAYVPFPHIGGVIIESGVSIGTNTCIAKGALSDTIIKANSVIDSFVQVGHNVLVEENVLILSNVVIGGSSVVKKSAVLAIGAHICDYVIVGEYAHIGPGVVIVSSVDARAKVMPRLPLTISPSAQPKNLIQEGSST